MFDIGADELLLTAVVAIVVIGPKDMPRALRTVGRWVAKMRRMSNAFRSGIENVIREAELEDMEAEWRKQNAAIMAAHPPLTADMEAQAAAAAARTGGGVLPGPGPAPGPALGPAPAPEPMPEQPAAPGDPPPAQAPPPAPDPSGKTGA